MFRPRSELRLFGTVPIRHILLVVLVLGLAVTAHVPYGGAGVWPYTGLLSFATAAGVNYFLNDRLAIVFAGNYWGYGGGYVGLLLRLGKGETLTASEG